VDGLVGAGAEVLACPGVLQKPLSANVRIRPTLARGRLRIPYRLLGRIRALALHDYVVSRRLHKLAGQIDIIHTWPLGALRTLKMAIRLGIPAVLERPNAHTRFAYEVVQRECERIGVVLPPNHEHAYQAGVLRKEEQEYQMAYRLLCPSDFVVRTFLDEGFAKEKLVRHQYGFDDRVYFPAPQSRNRRGDLKLLFAGGCAPRKGLHYALEAWLQSPPGTSDRFLIAGTFVPGYAEKLSPMLSHRSVQVLGHRSDLADLMRQSDALILPTIEEGSALVTSEARGSGCVLLVSEAAGAYCEHMENALVHRAGDVRTLAEHITMLRNDHVLLERLRETSLSTVHEITWKAAGVRLLQAYKAVTAAHKMENHR